jgi:hypothetical protein
MYSEEERLWSDIKSQFLNDIKLLIEKNRFASALLLICTFIDIVSAFYTGRVLEKGVSVSFRMFIEDYMNIFCRTKFGDLLFSDKNKRVRDWGDMIYYCYRNGSTHEGILPDGIELFVDSDPTLIGGFGAIGTSRLNILGIYNMTVKAIEQYSADLISQKELQVNFTNRFQYLKRQRFKKDKF